MKHSKPIIVILGAALFTAACSGQVSTATGGAAGGGGGMAGSGNGATGTAGGGTGGAGTGGASTSGGNGGTAGSGGLPPCGADGSGVCISSGQVGCPIGFILTQMGCDPGGGGLGSCCLPSAGSFSCGSSACDTATQYCLVSSGGPCCEPPSYTCVDLPQACLSPGADCTCFEQADCPCGGGPGPCTNGGTWAGCDTSQGGLMFSCAYP